MTLLIYFPLHENGCVFISGKKYGLADMYDVSQSCHIFRLLNLTYINVKFFFKFFYGFCVPISNDVDIAL